MQFEMWYICLITALTRFDALRTDNCVARTRRKKDINYNLNMAQANYALEVDEKPADPSGKYASFTMFC